MTQYALISVSDKTGIVELAKAITAMNVSILSTGGTAELLQKNGIQVTEVADHTGFPEMLDGRVKTLHPKIHGGILARRDKTEHVTALQQHGISKMIWLSSTSIPLAKQLHKKTARLKMRLRTLILVALLCCVQRLKITKILLSFATQVTMTITSPK